MYHNSTMYNGYELVIQGRNKIYNEKQKTTASVFTMLIKKLPEWSAFLTNVKAVKAWPKL